jgi:hypothetical protein
VRSGDVCVHQPNFNCMLKNPYVRISLRFGLVGAVLVLLYFLTFYFLGENPIRNLSTFDVVIVLLTMVFAIGYFRDRMNRGNLVFWEGLAVGNLTSLLAIFVSTVAIYGFIAFIDPALIGRHITEMQEIVAANRAEMEEQFGADAYEQTLASLATTTPLDIAFDVFIKKFLICFVASGVIAAVLRRPPPVKS